ncbi:MAG: hypothetical protein MZU84_02735 [Sphingobacterium sp.]|nr:hypothetical protein [Sphingobacterium sp.]
MNWEKPGKPILNHGAINSSLMIFTASAVYPILPITKSVTLSGNTDLDLKYGSFDIESIDARFENMTIKSAYSDITAGFDATASFEFEIRHINAFVVLPDSNIKSTKEAPE